MDAARNEIYKMISITLELGIKKIKSINKRYHRLFHDFNEELLECLKDAKPVTNREEQTPSPNSREWAKVRRVALLHLLQQRQKDRNSFDHGAEQPEAPTDYEDRPDFDPSKQKRRRKKNTDNQERPKKRRRGQNAEEESNEQAEESSRSRESDGEGEEAGE